MKGNYYQCNDDLNTLIDLKKISFIRKAEKYDHKTSSSQKHLWINVIIEGNHFGLCYRPYKENHFDRFEKDLMEITYFLINN